MAQNIEIFIINLVRSKDRRESMKRKIAGIRGFKEIYIDGEKITHPLAPSAREGESISSLRGESMRSISSLRENERSEFSWQSKSRESKQQKESMTEKQINADSLQVRDSQKMQILHNGLPRETYGFSRNDEKLRKESSLRGSLSEAKTTKQSKDSPSLAEGVRGWVDSHNTTLHFHFFPATDANDFKDNPANIPTHYHPKLTRFVKGKDLSSGEIACFSSHYRLWEKCVALDLPIVVLEDDIDFMQDFCQIVKIFKSPFEYVRLVYTMDKKITHLQDNFYISFDRICGTMGYYLTPTVARKFIKNARFWLFCVDDYMDMFFIHNVKNIIFLPFIITEDVANATQSTILGREKPKMSFWRKLTRELSRIYFYVIRKGLYLLVFYACGRKICPHSSLRGESQDSPKQSTNQKNGWLLRFARKSCGLPRKSCGFSRNDGEV